MTSPARQHALHEGAPWRDLYPFESHWLTIPHGAHKHRLHYVDEGDREAPCMLMVHGNPTWSFYYRRLIETFRDEYRCVALDHIGCGLSDKPQKGYGYTLRERINDLSALIDSLDLDRITLVIHDWGGAIGMGAAARVSDRIDRIVVFNTAAFRSDRIPFSIDICRIPGFGPLAVRGLNGFARVAQYRAIYDKSRLEGAVGQGYLAPYDSWANRLAIQRFVEDIPMDLDHPSYQTLVEVEQGLESFGNTPMMIAWGEQDFCFDASFRREWERRFPEATVYAIDDASHYVLEDAHERIIPWMRLFFGKNPVDR